MLVRKMKELLMLIAFQVLAVCSVDALEVGELIPDDALITNEFTLVSGSQLGKSFKLVEGEIEYKLVSVKKGIINYIGVVSRKFSTPEGATVGMSFENVRKLTQKELVEEAGWGYYLKLPSGWAAAFVLVKAVLPGL